MEKPLSLQMKPQTPPQAPNQAFPSFINKCLIESLFTFVEHLTANIYTAQKRHFLVLYILGELITCSAWTILKKYTVLISRFEDCPSEKCADLRRLL